jgi:hypothetical protein
MSKLGHSKHQNLQAMAEAETDTALVKEANDRVIALAALYQGEKTDASYVFNTAMVMMGVAAAYLVGAIPFVDKLSQGGGARPFDWLFLLLLPSPLWLIVAFHSLITLNAMSHGISVRIIEDALFQASGLLVDRDMVGSAAGDKIMDITQAKPAHKLTTLVVYRGVGLLVIGFTAYALYSANGIVKSGVVLGLAPVVWIAIGTYLLLLVMVTRSWIVGIRMMKKGRL